MKYFDAKVADKGGPFVMLCLSMSPAVDTEKPSRQSRLQMPPVVPWSDK